ncbi:phosphomannomutase/phosphoglucomutase [Galactobacter sp.]|uniref:phosphomannomutase/phosphoglucomutase n=1 Tax=Galactobacter sp. TaxID=2676125 RepID=UPI0025B8DE1B|nr:phosphomannomutase/phosphoglucomutase [Galactobacter sp.]
MTSTDLSRCFKAYDVRGLVGQDLTEEVVRAIGAAFADVLELQGQTVLIGRDMRPSSELFALAFAEGAASRGARPTMLGLISTDELYFACGRLHAAGVTFTASHNPAQYNGIKMAKPGAVPVSAETGLFDIRDLAQRYLDEGLPDSVPAPAAPQVRDVLADYAEYLRELVDVSRIRPLKVVVDAGNGMGGLTTPAVLGQELLPALPLTIEPLYFDLDGTFPNHPANPLEPANLEDLRRAVVEHEADLGLAFDGDADRCFVVDELGEPVTPSAITALVADREIARAKAAGVQDPVVIHNLITSRYVPELIASVGGRAVRTRVGHSYIKAVMASESAIFGGEHSAHYYFRDFFNADTGMLAALHVLAALGSQGLPLSQLASTYDPYFASGEINSEVEDKEAAVAAVLAVMTDQQRAGTPVTVETLDGTTVSAEDGSWWFNLRPSNTEPFLRYNGEATTPATMAAVRDQVLAIVRGEA